jgi:hypothetical protein
VVAAKRNFQSGRHPSGRGGSSSGGKKGPPASAKVAPAPQTIGRPEEEARQCTEKLFAIIGGMEGWEKRLLDVTRQLAEGDDDQICKGFVDYHGTYGNPGAAFPGISADVRKQLLQQLKAASFGRAVRKKLDEVSFLLWANGQHPNAKAKKETSAEAFLQTEAKKEAEAEAKKEAEAEAKKKAKAEAKAKQKAEVEAARDSLAAIGVLELLGQAKATSDTQLLSAANFCTLEGIKETHDIAKYSLLDDFIVALGSGLGRASVGRLRERIEAEHLDGSELESKKKFDALRATYEGESTFYFVSAAKIRESDEVTLPRMQELQRREGWLVKQEVTLECAITGRFATSHLGVSHRWEMDEQPDSRGHQYRKVKAFLLANPEVEWVWYDFWCMPQRDKTSKRANDLSIDEIAEMKAMLGRCNLIYMGLRILIILDLSYMSRFWTQFEAWLSMQSASANGVHPAHENDRRCTIVTIHGAPTSFKEELVDMWASKTPIEAHEFLSQPDVTVTNQSDKEAQLPKLFKLEADVKQCFANM